MSLKKVEQWGDLRHLLERCLRACGEDLFERPPGPGLYPLSLEWPDDVEPNGGGDGAAQGQEEQEPLSVASLHTQPHERAPQNGREMGRERLRAHQVLNLSDRISECQGGGPEECLALGAARPVGDVRAEMSVAAPVYFRESRRVCVGGGGERQGGAAHIPEQVLQVASELRGAPDLAQLNGGLEAGRVREAAHRKGGVGELPQESPRYQRRVLRRGNSAA